MIRGWGGITGEQLAGENLCTDLDPIEEFALSVGLSAYRHRLSAGERGSPLPAHGERTVSRFCDKREPIREFHASHQDVFLLTIVIESGGDGN
jgi:hypothetical protein